ncbi:enoyl-CoA hydratase/isomerase family protein [Mycobacterium sp. 050134]|uniref:enoyl-CoA hydratase/isomerase family protein n=1 Tax=Mycobacterium sp. 050134 TaxID=3096111 RepID=UPI002ED891A2
MTILTDDTTPGIRILTISEPSTRNAMTAATYRQLTHAIADSDERPGLRIVIITGHDKIFTSGTDLRDFQDHPDTTAALALLYALAGAEIPIIAAVEGHAIGIGTTMLLHCDFAYAGASTKFALPFTRLGLSPQGATSLLLPRNAGDKRASAMLLFGNNFTAHDAQIAGIINDVVDDGTALATALAAAHQLIALPEESVRMTKRLLRDRDAILEAITREASIFAKQLRSPEAQSAISHFFNDRT